MRAHGGCDAIINENECLRMFAHPNAVDPGQGGIDEEALRPSATVDPGTGAGSDQDNGPGSIRSVDGGGRVHQTGGLVGALRGKSNVAR